MKSTYIKNILLALITGGSVAIAGYLYLGTAIEKVIFRPEPLDPDHEYSFRTPFRELMLFPEEGAAINALYFYADQPKGVILYFHGNVGNIDRWGEVAEPLSRLGYDVMIPDYRGYGKSVGLRTEQTLFHDALYCYNYLKQEMGAEKVVIYGRSLGTGIASWLAAQTDYDGLILETPYFSMTELARRYLPSALVKRHLEFHFDSAQYLQHACGDILILHGTDDEVVPYDSGKKLFQSIPEGEATFVSFNGAGHNDLAAYEKYWSTLTGYLNSIHHRAHR